MAGTKGMPRAARERLILDAAGALFASRGYDGASLSALAATADVTKPLVISYFGTKDSLYAACLADAAAHINACVDAEFDPASPRLEQVTAVLRGLFTAFDARPWAWGLLFELSPPPIRELEQTHRAARHRLTGVATQRVAEAAATLGVADPLDVELATDLWIATLNTAVRWRRKHPQESAERTLGRATDLILRVMAPSLTA